MLPDCACDEVIVKRHKKNEQQIIAERIGVNMFFSLQNNYLFVFYQIY
jgi:hypothetical protein